MMRNNDKIRIAGIICVLLFVPLLFFNKLIAIFFTFAGIFLLLYSFNERTKIHKLNQEKNENILTDYLKNQTKSRNNKYILSQDKKQMIALNNEMNKMLHIVLNDDLSITKKEYNYGDLLQSNIVEDNIEITKVSRTGQIGGAILGGILAGGIGSIIGGLTSSRVAYKEVHSLNLSIIVDDLDEPLIILNLFRFNNPIKKTNSIYVENMDKATYWHNLISVLIKRADEKELKEKI